MAILNNSSLRLIFKPGTVISVFGKIGVVYEDGDDGVIRLNCLNHEKYSFRPSLWSSPIEYEILGEHEHPPIVEAKGQWNFVSNIKA